MDKREKDIRDKMDKISKDLSCHELNKSIEIKHLDGSTLFLNNCRIEGEYIEEGMTPEILYVWTEHLGNFYFFVEDLKEYFVTDSIKKD